MLQRLDEVQRQHRRLQQEVHREVWRSVGLSTVFLLLLAMLVPSLDCLHTRVASAGEPEYLEQSEAVGINP